MPSLQIDRLIALQKGPSYKCGMKKRLATLALLAAPSLASAGNYATCLLEKLPGLQNDIAASAAIQACSASHPDGFATIPQGDGRGILSFDSGAECTADKSGDTRSRMAAFQIRQACNRLFDKPLGLFDDLKSVN